MGSNNPGELTMEQPCNAVSITEVHRLTDRVEELLYATAAVHTLIQRLDVFGDVDWQAAN